MMQENEVQIPLWELQAEIRLMLTRGTSKYATAFLLAEADRYLAILADPFDLEPTRHRVGAFEQAIDTWLRPANSTESKTA